MDAPCELIQMDFDCAMYWSSPDYIVEEKFDGRRAVVSIGRTAASVTGRRWISPGVLAPLARAEAISGIGWHQTLIGCVFDGELMPDGTYWIFDCLRFRGDDVRHQPLHDRKRMLASVADFLPLNVRIVRSVATVPELGDFGEGVVWKRLSAPYGVDWFKGKRTETLDVRVARVFPGGVAEVEGHGKVVGVPASVAVGDLIEVEAFQVLASGKLRNGRFIRVRDDK